MVDRVELAVIDKVEQVRALDDGNALGSQKRRDA